MTKKIIFNFVYNLFCSDCGNLVSSGIIPAVSEANLAEFTITGYTCSSCGNTSEFNIAKSEIKRLKIID